MAYSPGSPSVFSQWPCSFGEREWLTGWPMMQARGTAGDELAGEEVHGRDHERAGGGGDEAHDGGGEGEPAGEEPVEFVVEGDEAVGAEDGEEV